MGLFSLIVKELTHRWGTALLSVLAVAVAAGSWVAVVMLSDAANRETRRNTRDIGFNLRIIPADTDMNRFYRDGFSRGSLPEDSLAKLSGTGNVSYNHLVATLQMEADVNGYPALVTGLAPEVFPPGQKKPIMSPTMKRGTAHAGFDLARTLNLKKGDSLNANGVSLTVSRVMPEAGSLDDVRLITSLEDAQAILGQPGRINEIKAIDCLCLIADDNPLGILRDEIGKLVPGGKVVMLRDIADARAKQRQLLEKVAAYGLPAVLVVCAIWVGALAMLNVRSRTSEIGLWRGLGYGANRIAALFLGKAVLIGLFGALLGVGIGTAVALTAGPELFPVTSGAIRWQPDLLWRALAGAPVFAALASFLPMLAAVSRDPADVLREE